MKWFIQILGAATHDSRPSVIVHFDSQRYLFNCGEGSQRLCNDQKVRLAKLRSIFLTRLSWDCLGGLPGMMLTVADAGSKQLRILGPAGLAHAMAGMRQFLFRPSFLVDTVEFPIDLPEYSDENLTVTPIPIYPDPTTTTTDPLSASRQPAPRRRSTSPKGVSPKRLDGPGSRREIERLILSTMFGTIPGSSNSKVSSAPSELPPASAIENVAPAPTCKLAPPPPVSHTARVRNTERLPKMEPNVASLVYVCKGPDVPGKMDAAAAKKLGVKIGADMGRLSRGESVTLEDGTVVHSHQCVAPTKPGAVFCIIDCPSPAYISSIVSAPKLHPTFLMPNLKSIVHILGQGVLEHPDYKAWMNSFGEMTQHIVASPDYTPCETLLHSTATINGLLNCIDPEVFPVPFSTQTPDIDINTDLPKTVVLSRPQLILQMEPKPFLDTREIPSPVPAPDPAVHPLLKQALEEMEVVRAERGDGGCGHHHSVEMDGGCHGVLKDMVVVPFGTGAAIPSKYRNASTHTTVSSTFLMVPEGNIILDSGEGTLGQMFRHFGPGRFQEELLKVRLLFLSHLHADHHLGAIGILKMRRKLDLSQPPSKSPLPRLHILAPRTYLQWLSEYSDCEDFGLDSFVLIASEDVAWTPSSPTFWGGKEVKRKVSGGGEGVSEKVQSMLEATGMTDGIQAVGVIHCPAAYGVVLKHHSGSSFVFSGDCRPTPNLVKAGHGATLLIHEATFEDDKPEEAIEKRHCTTSEAIQVAKDQRYPKLPKIGSDDTTPSPTHESGKASRKRRLGEGVEVVEPVVGVAFDLMRVRVGEFGRLPGLLGPLRTLWRDVESVEEE
ncbi:Zinc phosphodiesterase ELAC protein 2 [Dinochytrium kinnereticum]|nr:Zinc phosphodiesterase ELAC protein 2 [Dinochytrium kinnereticum]